MKFFTDVSNLLLLLAAISSGVFLLLPYFRARGGAASVSTLEATQLMNRKNAVVIDVREAAEFATGHLLGAKNIARGDLGTSAGNLAKDKATPILLVCATGVRSNSACKELTKLGYTEVKNLQGGVTAWQTAGLPLTKN